MRSRPTLSPTLSAITAGLRDRPPDTGLDLATRSAPTSAAGEEPPPRRAKTEISEPPKPCPISASLGRFIGTARISPRIAGHPSRASPATTAVIAPPLKATSRAFAHPSVPTRPRARSRAPRRSSR